MMKHFLASILLALAVLTAPLAHAGGCGMLLCGAGSSGGGSPPSRSYAFVDFQHDGSFSPIVTLSMTFGTVNTGDLILLGLPGDASLSVAPTSVTVNGQALTLITTFFSTGGTAMFYAATATSGFSGTNIPVVITSTGFEFGCSVWILKNLTSNTVSSENATNSASLSVTVPTGGFLFAVSNGNATASYTGSTSAPTAYHTPDDSNTQNHAADWAAPTVGAFSVVPESGFSHPVAAVSFQ